MTFSRELYTGSINHKNCSVLIGPMKNDTPAFRCIGQKSANRAGNDA